MDCEDTQTETDADTDTDTDTDADTDADTDTDTDTEPAPLPTSLPEGAILLFDLNFCPGAWEEVVIDGRYVRVDDGLGAPDDNGGSATHGHDTAHTHALSQVNEPAHGHGTVTMGASHDGFFTSGTDLTVTSDSHHHGEVTFSTSAGGPHTHSTSSVLMGFQEEAAPPWREAVLCRATRNLPLNAPARVLIDADTCPSTLETDGTYAGRLLRGSDLDIDIAETGGTEQHSHAFEHRHNTSELMHGHTFTMSGGPVGTTRLGISSTGDQHMGNYTTSHTHGGEYVTEAGHRHVAPAETLTTGESPQLPPYAEVSVCAATEEQDALPEDIVVLFEAACPVGWRAKQDWAGRFLRGRTDASAPRLGGSETHDHTAPHDHGGRTEPSNTSTYHTAGTGWVSETFGYFKDFGSVAVLEVSVSHGHYATLTHPVAEDHDVAEWSSSLGAASSLPSYREMVLCEPSR